MSSRWENLVQAALTKKRAPTRAEIVLRGDDCQQRSKYNNVKTDGYDSKLESKRAKILKLLEQAGEIRDLREQVPFEIIPKQDGERSAKYVADFVYVMTETGETIVEDCKGMKTAAYILKRKLMLKVHGIKIKEMG